jgi:hypothetical protein
MTAADVRYCERCGAQIAGDGSWGHDDNCPRLESETEPMPRGPMRPNERIGYPSD